METKRYKFWYKLTLTVGLLGLIDVVTQGLVKQLQGIEVGGITFAILYIFRLLFGTAVAVATIKYVFILSATWFIWLGVSAFLRRKIKKLERANRSVPLPAQDKGASKDF